MIRHELRAHPCVMALTWPVLADWKIAVAVRDDLQVWQKLNVAAFVTSGIGTAVPAAIGEEYVDASGVTYLPKLGLPIRLFAGDQAGVRRAFDRALARGLHLSVYTDDLFTTGNDVDNRAAVASIPTERLIIAGFAVAGQGRQVDRALDKLHLHP